MTTEVERYTNSDLKHKNKLTWVKLSQNLHLTKSAAKDEHKRQLSEKFQESWQFEDSCHFVLARFMVIWLSHAAMLSQMQGQRYNVWACLIRFEPQFTGVVLRKYSMSPNSSDSLLGVRKKAKSLNTPY